MGASDGPASCLTAAAPATSRHAYADAFAVRIVPRLVSYWRVSADTVSPAARAPCTAARWDSVNAASRPDFLPSAHAQRKQAYVRSIGRSRSTGAPAARRSMVILPAALVRSVPPSRRRWTLTHISARRLTVETRSMMSLPNRSSFVTSNTSVDARHRAEQSRSSALWWTRGNKRIREAQTRRLRKSLREDAPYRALDQSPAVVEWDPASLRMGGAKLISSFGIPIGPRQLPMGVEILTAQNGTFLLRTSAVPCLFQRLEN
jgi:hypothetical protein